MSTTHFPSRASSQKSATVMNFPRGKILKKLDLMPTRSGQGFWEAVEVTNLSSLDHPRTQTRSFHSDRESEYRMQHPSTTHRLHGFPYFFYSITFPSYAPSMVCLPTFCLFSWMDKMKHHPQTFECWNSAQKSLGNNYNDIIWYYNGQFGSFPEVSHESGTFHPFAHIQHHHRRMALPRLAVRPRRGRSPA